MTELGYPRAAVILRRCPQRNLPRSACFTSRRPSISAAITNLEADSAPTLFIATEGHGTNKSSAEQFHLVARQPHIDDADSARKPVSANRRPGVN